MIRIIDSRSAEADQFIDKLDRRGQFENQEILHTVSQILKAVKEKGDQAVIDYTEQFDSTHVSVENLRVTEAEFDQAQQMVDNDFLISIRKAKENIQKFHQRQVRQSWISTEENGVILGHLIRPLDRVGVCVPAVSQLLVSSLLMNVLPPKVVGVREIAIFMGPQPDGTIDPHMLMTASECNTKEIYKCGGAQAVAAMAYGTKSIQRVDKIVGPGNPYVQQAKRQVMGLVDIDIHNVGIMTLFIQIGGASIL